MTHQPEDPSDPASQHRASGSTPADQGWQLPGAAPEPPATPDDAAVKDAPARDSPLPAPGESAGLASNPGVDPTAYPPPNPQNRQSDWGALPVAPTPPLAGPSRWTPPPVTASAHRPGVVPLRPISVGEILDGAITYIRRNPLATLGTAAVLTAISGLIQAWLLFATAGRVTDSLTEFSSDPGSADLAAATLSLGQSAGLLAGTAVSWLIGILATGMLTVMMGAAIFGRKLDIAAAWRAFGPRLPALLVLTLLVGLSVGLVLIVGGTAAFFLGTLGAAGIVAAVLVGLASIVAAVWLWVSLVLSPVVLVLENRGPLRAWRRSLTLVRGAWWRVFGIQLLATIIASVIAGIVSVPFQFGATSFGAPDGEPNAAFWLLITLGSVVAGVITLPFTAGVTSLLYLDRRMRREAFDLTLTAALPADGPAPEDAAGAEPSWLALYREPPGKTPAGPR